MTIKPEEEHAQSPDTNEPEMVELHEADLESLDAAIANAQAEEANAGEVEEVETEQQQQPSAEVAPVAAPSAIPSNPAQAAKAPPSPEDIQRITAENERLKKQNESKELFIQHRGNELGKLKADNAELTRRLTAARDQLASGLEDRFAENPVQASNDRDKIKEIDEQITAVTEQEKVAAKIVQAQTLFLRHVDTEKVSIDDLAEVLRSDGIPEEYIPHFKANPWTFTTEEALVQMGKRAMDKKGFLEADNDRRLLARHVLHLNSEIEKLKGKPRAVMSQVQRNLNQPQAVTSASTSTPRAARDLDPTRMTTAELDAALKGAMRN